MRILLKVLVALSVIVGSIASSSDNAHHTRSDEAPPLGSLTSLQGYPGAMSREAVQEAVNLDIRNQILTMAEESRLKLNTTRPRLSRGLSKSKSSDDFSNLNDILKTFRIQFTDLDFSAPVLGVTASVEASVECGDLCFEDFNLDYKKGGSSLTYEIEALGIALKCQILVDWDLGVLDVSDNLKIKVGIKDTDIQLSTTLKGSPPTSASFNGCEIEVNVDSLSSQGGFSSDILNELSDLILAIVANEMEFLSDILCEEIDNFGTEPINDILQTLNDIVAPYLTQVQEVDPLRLEKNLDIDEPLVDFTDSTIGDVIQIFIDNLQGVVGAFQINTLIELNLLNDRGGLDVDLSSFSLRRRLQDDSTEECSIFRNRQLRETTDTTPYEDLARQIKQTVEAELTAILEPVLPKELERQLQRQLQGPQVVFPTENLFVLNEIAFQTLEIVGLNTFQDTQYLEIIGKQTFRTVLELLGLGIRLNFVLDASINENPIRENIQVTLHINGVFAKFSYLVGLSEEEFNSLTLATLVNNLDFNNALNCILSTLRAAGLSELDVTVDEVEAPVVEGVLDTGVDEVINTAVEAAVCTYQDLILTAIPNIAQNNITVIVNDFLECFVRTTAADAECEMASTNSILESTGLFEDDDGGGGGGIGFFGVSEGAGAPGGQQNFDLSNSIGESSFGGSMTFTFAGDEDEVTTFNTGSSSSGDVWDTSGVNGPKTIIMPPLFQNSAQDSNQGFSVSGGSTSTPNTFVEKTGSFVGADLGTMASASADGHIRGFVDFRDLLLPPDEALRLGGSGRQPYGNLIAMAFSAMKDQLVAIDNSTGLPSINANLLRPLTSAQSGVAGLLRFPGLLFNQTFDTSVIEFLHSLLQRIEIRGFDARVDNLDTVVGPVSFFQPTNQAHVLENIINFGPVDGRPLNISLTLNFDLEGVDSPIAMSNEIDLNAMAAELDVFTNIRILIPIREFLNFPLTDILNLNCWLALLQPDVTDIDGGDKIKNAMGIRDFLMKVVSMAVNVKCLNCTSPSLPEVIGLFQQVGAIELLGSRLGLLLEDVLTSDFAPTVMTEILRLGEGAASLCPHSPTYNTTINNTTMELDLQLPALSKRSIDTVVFASVLGVELVAVLVSESILRNGVKAPVGEPEAEVGEALESVGAIEEENLLDWTRLNETFIPFAGDLLNMAKGYLGPQGDGSESLGINQLLGNFLGSDGSWNLALNNMAYEFGGLEIVLQSVGIGGLSTFAKFDVFEPISPQTLQNSMHLDTLSLKVDFSINVTANSDPPEQFSVAVDFKDVNTTVLIYTSIDMSKVEALEFGSLMWIENILPCFLSTSTDIHIPAMQLSIGSMSNRYIRGLQYESSRIVSETLESIFYTFGSDIIDAVNLAFNTTLRGAVNNYLSSFISNSSCSYPSGSSGTTSSRLLDFRDLLLSPENARSLGGSGTQPYGDLFPMLFGMLQSNVLKGANDGLLEVNSVFIDPLTESQSGEPGLLQFKDELFALAMSFLPGDTMAWLEAHFNISAFDARIDNINTLVGPLSLLQPSHRAHVFENMLNFGPVPDRPLNASLGMSVGLNGSIPFLDTHNRFDLSATVDGIDLFADLAFMVIQDRLFNFPLRDALEMHCWLSLIGIPSTNDTVPTSSGLEIKSLLLNLMTLSLDLNCVECTNVILPELVKVLDVAGVSRVLGNRLGPLLQEIATSQLLPSLMEDFIALGDEAAKLCPHDPLFGQNPLNSSTVDLSTLLPPLSGLTLDTLLFAAVVATEAAAVIFADNHNKSPLKEIETIQNKNLLIIPEGASLIDWTNLNETQIPFIPQMFSFIHDSLSGGELNNPAINSLLSGVIGSNGVLELPLGGFSVEEFGVQLSFHHLKVQGLTSFTNFEILYPASPQTLSNDISMKEVTIGLNISVDVLETTEPPKHVNFSLKFEDVSMSLPVYVAIDEDKLGSITIGSLLHSSNIMPCLLSAAYGFRVQEMVVSVGSIVGAAIEGFRPDSGSAITNSVGAILDRFGETIVGSLPQLFNGTAKALLNGFLSNIESSECQQFSADNTSAFVDFREVFAVYDESDPSPYGDFIPLVKGLLESELLSMNPETQMPKINDVLIAPLTRGQSGTVGSLSMEDELLSFSFGGLKQLGLDEITFKLFDAKSDNLDTIGAPLQILEPNKTSGFLLDNRATFGTKLRPLRFAIKSNLSLSGSLLNTQDEIEFFAELHGAPLFAVLMARIGSQELLTYPLRYVTELHCWLSTLATPTLKAIGRGETEVDSALAIHYIEMFFSSFRVGASCFNCTNPGLAALPVLLQVLETSGAKDVLARRTLDFGMEVLESDFSQVWILRFLQDSMRKCPRTKDMPENSIVIASPPFPVISLQWLETVAFGALVSAQSGAAILAETLTAFAPNMRPIFNDPEPDYPPETRLVNFTNLDAYPVGSVVKYFIAGANSYLGESSIDPETGETSLGINELLGENPILPLDSYSMDFEDLGVLFSNFRASLKSITIEGLDTFTKFRVMDIVGDTQLNNELGWKSLQIELALEIEVDQREGSIQEGEKLAFTLQLEAIDIEASLQLMLALDYELVKNLQLGSLLHMAHILPCIQATIQHLAISDVQMNIGQISKMRISGFKSRETSKAAEVFERLILEEFGDSLAQAAPTLFSLAAKPLLNTAVMTYLRDSDFKCNEFPFDADNSGFVDFRDLLLSPTQSKRFGGSGEAQYGDLIRTAYGILRLQLLTAHPENGIAMLTPIVGSLSFPGVLLNQGMRFDFRGINADITLRVSDARINNLDSIGKPLSILAPIKGAAHQLNNTGTFGIGNKPLNFAARFYLHIKGLTADDIVNDFDLSLDIHAATVVLTVLMKVSEMAFVRFPLRDMLNVNCWLALIPPPSLDDHGFREQGSEPTAALTDLDITSQELSLNLNCHNCTSPAFYEFGELMAMPKSQEEMTELVNRLLDALADKLGGAFLQDQINRILVDAPKHCGHTDVYDPGAGPTTYAMFNPGSQGSSHTYIPMLIVIFLPFVVSAVVAFSVRLLVLRRQSKWLKMLPSEQIFLIQQKQEKRDREEAAINEISSSMYRSKEIPFILRQLVPVIIVANIGFFLSGHLNKGGRILVQFVFAGEKFILDDFFTFSIGQSTVDMWHAGGRELAVLILLFSGVWPYTKQLITLALWFLPPAVVSCPRRGHFLLWLDILAKWSMIDIFVMLITVAGFRVSIRSPDLAFFPENLYAVDLVVVPMWGLYANMIAQLISQISSHFIVHYHRRIIKRAKQEYERRLAAEAGSSLPANTTAANGAIVLSDPPVEPRTRLSQHSFARQHRIASEKLTVRRFINYIMLSGGIMVCALLVVSCDIPSMKLEALGIVALVIELGQGFKQAVRYESVFSMASLLIDQAKFLGGIKNYIGLGTVASLFIFTVLVVPITQILALLCHWFAPLTANRRKQVAVFLEILQAWQYVEVYILAIIIESWQLGSISKLMLNRFCSSLEFTLNLLVYYGVLDEGDAQCFALEASIMAGAYLFVPLTCCLALLNAFVVKAYIQQIREKKDEEDEATEDEKLRAFDRTTWDSRREAMNSIRNPPVLFTDTFRWLLRRDLNARSSDLWRKKRPAPESRLMEIETMPLAKTSGSGSSDEEHAYGGEASSTVESAVESTTEEVEETQSDKVSATKVDC